MPQTSQVETPEQKPTPTDTEAGTALMLRPTCPANPSHGFMELRPLARQTYEQKFCGVWYDCGSCHSSVLFHSKELDAQLAESCERIRQAGREARSQKIPRKRNPYSTEIARQAWNEGWSEVRATGAQQ